MLQDYFLCNFASTVWLGEFSGHHFDCLGKGMVKEAVDQVATFFSETLRDEPRNEDSKELDLLF